RSETQRQIKSAVRLAAVIFFALLFVATMISLGIGQVIAAPIIRLTQTADQIVAGDLTAQAKVASRDEIGTLAQAFNTMTSRLRGILEVLEQRVAERTSELAAANEKNERRAKQFESIAQVASTISSTRDMDSLLPQITTVISNQFGFYHVGIFLLDPRGEYAVLSAANSEGGQRMLARNHQLRVGETGIVGFVTGTGKPRVALNTGEDAVFFNNPDLPETRSEISLPLRVGDEVIGALDVQSTKPDAFDQEDINILTTLADQVGIAIQNSRQYEETRKALAESELLSQQFIQTGWQQFTKSKKLAGIRHTGARATLLYRKNGKNKNENDLNWEQAKTEFNSTSLSLPVKLHGQVIGSVDVRAPGNRKWEQDELDIVTAIIERAALAMENARLLAESQKRAAKERTIGEISAKIGMQSDINELLKTAAQELGQTLPGAEIAIQFNKDDE
ncbi:MAG TPA: GAF domain-containing protein, partial [Anaerolineales bacterium]